MSGTHVQKQRREKTWVLPWLFSRADTWCDGTRWQFGSCFRTLDSAGPAGDHASCTGLQRRWCCGGCLLTPEAETPVRLQGWVSHFALNKACTCSFFSRLLTIWNRKLQTASVHLCCTFSVLRCDSFTVQPMILSLILRSRGRIPENIQRSIAVPPFKGTLNSPDSS